MQEDEAKRVSDFVEKRNDAFGGRNPEYLGHAPVRSGVRPTGPRRLYCYFKFELKFGFKRKRKSKQKNW